MSLLRVKGQLTAMQALVRLSNNTQYSKKHIRAYMLVSQTCHSFHAFVGLYSKEQMQPPLSSKFSASKVLS